MKTKISAEIKKTTIIFNSNLIGWFLKLILSLFIQTRFTYSLIPQNL